MIEDLVLRIRAIVDSSVQTAMRVVSGAHKTVQQFTEVMVAGAIAIGSFVRHAALGITEQKRFAESIGATTAEVQELTFAFEAFGADLPDVADAINTITDRALDAVGGMESFIDDFGLIGVKVSELRGKKPIELFELIARKFGETTDAAKRTTAAVRLFGDDLGRKLLPMLTRGASELAKLREQAHQFGVIVNEETAQAAEDFTVKLGLLQARFQMLATGIGVRFLPVADRLLERFTDLVDAGLPIAFNAIDKGAQFAEAAFDRLDNPMGRVLLTVGGLMGAAGLVGMATQIPILGGLLTALMGPLGMTALGMVALAAAADEVNTFLTSDDAQDSVIGRLTEWLGITKDVKREIEELDASWGTLTRNLRADVATVTSLVSVLGDMEDILVKVARALANMVLPGAGLGTLEAAFKGGLDNLQRTGNFLNDKLAQPRALLAIAEDRVFRSQNPYGPPVPRDLNIKMEVNGNADPALKEEIAREVRGAIQGELTQAQLAAAG